MKIDKFVAFSTKQNSMSRKAVAIFCGSKVGINVQYKSDAAELGTLLGRHGCTVIYGGGKAGLMGVVADATMAAGGTVTGVIPQVLVQWEAQHTEITELLVVEDMHVRKRKLYELCDAAVILPGGFGTLDELFEILTWNNLSIHDKKVIILNSSGFYNHLLAHLQQMQSEGFLYHNVNDILTVANSVDEAAAALMLSGPNEIM